MKRSLQTALLIGLASVGTALATPPPVSPGDGVPAAPEPNLMLMAVIGLALVFGYALWRRRQLRSQANS